MNIITNIIHLNFLKNKELKQLYVSILIMTFGEALINLFVPIYLFNKGFQIYEILIFYFLVSFYFLFFAYLGAKIVAKVGDKHAILLSTPFLILYYIGLIFIEAEIFLFFLLPLFLALRMIFFNYGHHLIFINNSEEKKRGQEISFFGIVTLLATMFAPYIGGVFAGIDFTILFIISALMMVAGTIPLFLSKDKYESIVFTNNILFKKIFSKENKGNFISFSGYAVESIIGRTIWPIFIIIIVGTVEKTGLIVSLSMIVSLFAFYFVGKLADKIDKVKLLRVGTYLYVVAWIGRIFAGTAVKILVIDSYKNLAGKILQIPWNAHSYNLALRRDCFEFIVVREIIFNLSRVVIIPFIIFLFWVNFYPFEISFIIASIFSIGYAFIKK